MLYSDIVNINKFKFITISITVGYSIYTSIYCTAEWVLSTFLHIRFEEKNCYFNFIFVRLKQTFYRRQVRMYIVHPYGWPSFRLVSLFGQHYYSLFFSQNLLFTFQPVHFSLKFTIISITIAYFHFNIGVLLRQVWLEPLMFVSRSSFFKFSIKAFINILHT